MESVIGDILSILQASPADYFIFGMGIGVVVWIASLYKRIKVMEHKYHLLNMSAVRLWDRVDPDMVQDHYSGDWSLKRKAANKDVV